MWAHVNLQTHVIWNEVAWSVTAIWQDDDGAEPVTMHKSGRAALADDDGPDAILAAALSALTDQALEGA